MLIKELKDSNTRLKKIIDKRLINENIEKV